MVIRRLRPYLDTTVVNFLFADDSPEKRDVTQESFEHHVRSGEYETFVSDIVVREITRATDRSHRDRLLDVIRDYNLAVLDSSQVSDEVQTLAVAYVNSGIITERKLDDALHVGLATVTEMDFLLSWNYKHLANVNKEVLIQAANLRHGYTKTPRMTTPMELIHEDG